MSIEKRIAVALDSLPQGSRGPKSSVLRASIGTARDLVECWPWQGRVGSNGYGITTRPGSRTTGSTAHRVVWELLNGPIPAGMQVDHLCHDPSRCDTAPCEHRRCVNPTHLALASARENTLRSNSRAAINAAKTTCSQGHPFDVSNTYVDPLGRRTCRTCYRAYDKRRRAS